ncbi:hypothetical protein QBC38DRAFT_463628 [Podospora fimiseda]|uniref:Uncharacterized protein n=1 Tax=Podospora fimiseda TaxID=252190 RepID=A0AAN7BZ35_9PEZI|nr:hypothetical protein QBC38DRAFT_463628 [Podospora fimiseda]
MANLPAQARGSGTSSLSPKQLQAAIAEASLILHSPPDFPKDAEVVGICALADNFTDQSQYAWMIADFLGFKLAFYRIGHRDHQSWLSTIDIPQFIRDSTQAEIPEDCPIQTHILGRNNDHIVQISNTSKEVENELLEHIRLRAQAANGRKSTLVLMFFAPITPDQDICLDFNSEKIYLTTTKICDTIRKAVGHSDLPVVYMTPAPFTTGWMCRPALMGPLCCTVDQALSTIAKSCGSAFADGFMKRLVLKNTPLLSDEERKKATYDIIMPTSATKEQEQLLHKFQEMIYRSLKRRLSPLALEYTMKCHDRFDAWEQYSARKGRPLSFWAERFTTLSTPDSDDRYEFLGAAFGGTKASQIFHLRYLVSLELDTCPGDWNRGTTGLTVTLFNGLFQTANPSEQYVERVFDTLEFRASAITLSQCLARALDLPFPDNLNCRYWHDPCQPEGRPTYYANLQAAFGETHNLFGLIAVNPREERHDFKVVRFFRSSRWLSAAIAQKLEDMYTELSGGPTALTAKKIVLEDMAPIVETLRNTQLRLLLGVEPIHRLGRSWLSSIGFCDDPTIALNKTRSIEAQINDPFVSTPCMDRTVSSTSVLNPEAPEYKAVGPKSRGQTPVRDNVPSGWTPMPPPQVPDKHSKPISEGVSTPTAASTGARAMIPAKETIETKKSTETQHPTETVKHDESEAPVNLMKLVYHVEFKPVQSANTAKAPAPLENMKPVGTSNPVELVKPVEPVKLVESVKPVENIKLAENVNPVENLKSAESSKPADNVKPVESVKPVENPQPAGTAKPADNGLKSDIEDQAAKVLSTLMSSGTTPELLAAIFKQAVQLVQQRDMDAERAAARQETAAQAGGESALSVTQHGSSLNGVDLASTSVMPAEAKAVRNPTPPQSPEKKDNVGDSGATEGANNSTGIGSVHQNGNTTSNAKKTSSGGLCDEDDFWAKAQQYHRRRWA